MNRFSAATVLYLLMFAAALPLHAQTGCTDSPENPTLVLGLVNAAGIGLYMLRSRIKSGTQK
jgi:XrtJ-associated TM-motif-TM protein